MVAHEFQKNQTFRYPEEYDKYDKEEDIKLKNYPLEESEKGFKKKDDNDYGQVKLETFKTNDQGTQAMERRAKANEQRARVSFERDLIEKA